ncbi:MAG TPA: hypothetical protein PK685_02215 [archaeon]|nr:hypothetical protein [archaeon]
MAVPRLLLRLRKAVTGKRATPKELGYERDPKTGRLTKPGTKKFNEKIAFEKENKEILIKEYKKRVKNAKELRDKKIQEQKLIDRRLQLNKRLQLMKLERKYDLKNAERKRLNAIKKRQTKEWVNKLNRLLKISGKDLTVQKIHDKLVNKVYEKLAKKAEREQRGLFVKAPSFSEVNRKVTGAFYSEIHKSVIPTEIKNMSPVQAIEFLEKIYKRVGRRLTR